MNTENVQVTVCRSDSGVPILRLDGRAELTWRVYAGDAATLRHIQISGNGDGLRALSEFLIGLAAAAGVHTHFDAESETGRLRGEQGFALTIGNTDSPRTTARSEPPPDWAK